jgi:hypothetical protein
MDIDLGTAIGVSVTALTTIVVGGHKLLNNYRTDKASANTSVSKSDADKALFDALKAQVADQAKQLEALHDEMHNVHQVANEQERHIMLLEMILDILAAQYDVDIDSLYAKYNITRRGPKGWGKKDEPKD